MWVDDIRLKELTLRDQQDIVEIGQALADAPAKGRGRIVREGLNDIIRLTTYVKKPRNKHRRKINKILEAHDVLNQKRKSSGAQKYKQALNRITAFFADELNQSPEVFKRETTNDIVNELYAKVLQRKLEHWIMAATVQHKPEDLKKYSQKMRSEIARLRRPAPAVSSGSSVDREVSFGRLAGGLVSRN